MQIQSVFHTDVLFIPGVTSSRIDWGLNIAKGEVGGPWVLAYFGTDVDQREDAIRVDIDRVEGIGVEQSDKK